MLVRVRGMVAGWVEAIEHHQPFILSLDHHRLWSMAVEPPHALDQYNKALSVFEQVTRATIRLGAQ